MGDVSEKKKYAGFKTRTHARGRIQFQPIAVDAPPVPPRIGAERRELDPNGNVRLDDSASARTVSTVKDDRVDEKLERKPRFNVFKVRDYVGLLPRARFGSPCAVFHLWVDMCPITVKIIR